MPYTVEIYKLRCGCGCGQIYIGSTRSDRWKRWYQHKQQAKDPKRKPTKLTTHMNEVGTDCFHIIPVHQFQCRDRTHQLTVEDEYITKFDTIKNGLNGMHAHVTEQLRVERVREQCNQQLARHLQGKQMVTCECGAMVTQRGLARHRNSFKHIRDFILHA